MIGLILVLIVVVYGSESNVIGQYDDPGTCICDLTLNSCDTGCCCDPDCNSFTLSYWKEGCAPERRGSDSDVYCGDSSDIYKINSRRGMAQSGTSSSQTCITVDNTAVLKNFHTLVASVSASQVSSRVGESYTYRNSLLYNPSSSSSGYTPGSVISELKLYAPNDFGLCTQTGVEFLGNVQTIGCTRVGLLSSICGSYLNISTYSSMGTITSIILRNSSTNTDTSVSPPLDTIYNNLVCTNSVIQADYIVYTNSTQSSVSSITVSLIVSNLSADSVIKIPQKFSLKFYTSSSYADFSGNPGYIIGKPLIAQVSGEYKVFSLRGVSSTGSCESTYLEQELKYGVNVVYSCYMSMNYASLQSYCNSHPDPSTISVFQNHSQFTQIGKWGKIVASNADDWVTITSTDPTNSSEWSSGYCKLQNTLTYNIYYSNQGSFANPQAKIAYAERYYQFGIWAFDGPNNRSPQNFLYSVVVNFIPYDTGYDPFYQGPRADTIMPQDVLDPFRTSGSRYLVVIILLTVF